MITEPRCPDSLVVRARIGSLGAEERARLDAHLAHCDDCQVALLIGSDFDRATATQRGDDALIAKLAEEAIAMPPARASLGRYRWLLLAAVLASISAGAAAATWRYVVPEPLVPAAQSRAPERAAPRHVRPPPIAPPAPVIAPEEQITPPAHVDRAPPVPDAATLFARANTHRRAGEVRAAIDDYRTLQRAHVHSTEAMVSHVVLGSLLLERAHDPAGALRQFDRYLGQSEHRDLTEEALFGRGRALERLGRADAERETWHRLLDHFPGSAYSPQARQRLAILE